jgi:hypothetical protein
VTIRIFGDSSTRRFRSLPDSWIEKVSSDLNQKVSVSGREIGDINNIYNAYYERKENIKPNDILIISLSSNTLDVDAKHLNDFLTDVDKLSCDLNLKTIVFFIFGAAAQHVTDFTKYPHIHFTKGFITDVAMNEWKKDFIAKHGREWLITQDVRVNHLTKNNHGILVKKVLDYIKNGTLIDLTTEFHAEILDKETINDPEFIKDQLFNGIMIKALKKLEKRQRKQQ